jgi:hypothetical protein
LLLVGCASPGATGSPDLSQARDLAMTVLADLSSSTDGAGSCTLGDPDHCGTCNTVCPPGMDDNATKRTCSGATCGYICRGEFYDVDGKAANGCEAQDLPIQNTASTAVTVLLPDMPLQASPGPNLNPTNAVSQIYGDMAEHEDVPTSRPDGREDWFKVVVTGAGASDRGVDACLGITSFPADNTFEVCLSANGLSSFLPAGCKQAVGMGASVCVQQPMAADESGIYFARVRRVSGATYSANKYALYLDH